MLARVSYTSVRLPLPSPCLPPLISRSPRRSGTSGRRIPDAQTRAVNKMTIQKKMIYRGTDIAGFINRRPNKNDNNNKLPNHGRRVNICMSSNVIKGKIVTPNTILALRGRVKNNISYGRREFHMRIIKICVFNRLSLISSHRTENVNEANRSFA